MKRLQRILLNIRPSTLSGYGSGLRRDERQASGFAKKATPDKQDERVELHSLAKEEEIH